MFALNEKFNGGERELGANETLYPPDVLRFRCVDRHGNSVGACPGPLRYQSMTSADDLEFRRPALALPPNG